MDNNLNEIEARILGSLIEKELTTPEYYPLSLNALVNACNQKSNREPQMSLTDEDVARGLNRLRFLQHTVVSGENSRVAKYRHILAERLELIPAELAILCELLIRGPQTLGELKLRCDRMFHFESIDDLEGVINDLSNRNQPLLIKLSKQPGQKEARYAHLFSEITQTAPSHREPPLEPAMAKVIIEDERITTLENEVKSLRNELEELKKSIAEFRSQFE